MSSERYGREDVEIREESILGRNIDLEEQVDRVGEYLKEGLKRYVEDPGIGFSEVLADSWVEFAGRRFAVLAWHLRVLFDAYHHADKIATDPLRVYEAVVKRIVEAAENQSHIFDELLELLKTNADGLYQITDLPRS